ncbi:hypothetical protein KEM56_002405 [Ascosphaera pollenicola]|nr:hypothetical protein KEM56_002405 [Ascosphaera pollenicola]
MDHAVKTAEGLPFQKQKVCYVTVGATAPFDSLVAEVLSHQFLQALAAKEYTHLIIQHGRCSDFIRAKLDEAKRHTRLIVQGYEFKENLETDFLQVKADLRRNVEEGVVLSHAGSGTILQVMRLGIPLIVVPNPDLMNNHQDELAHALSKEKYVIHGRLGYVSQAISSMLLSETKTDVPQRALAMALEEAEIFRHHLHDYPKNHSKSVSRGLAGVIEDELKLRIE